MALIALVASHRQVDLKLLERLSAGVPSLADAVVAGAATVGGAVVLATCNRLEVYLDIRQGDAQNPAGPAGDGPEDAVAAAVRATAAAVSEGSGVPVADVAAALRLRSGGQVPSHLFAVAAGLESMVVGEREIGGQVRRALAAARRAGTTTASLDRLFQAASGAARAAHAGTGLDGDGRSVVGVALDLAAPGGPWGEVRAVLVGTGSYAGASLAALRARGCTDVAVFSPSGRADAFAATHGVDVLAEPDLAAAVAAADLVVACSGTGGTPLAAGPAPRPTARPLVVVDLALRHDVDRRIVADPGVRLIDLETVRAAAPPRQAQAVAAAAAVVRAAAAEFDAAPRARSADQGVVALRRHASRLVEAEVARVRQNGAGATADVEHALHRLVQALLHGPTVRARELAARGQEAEYLAALRTLFGIEVEGAPRARRPMDRPEPAVAAGPDGGRRGAGVHTGRMAPAAPGPAARPGHHDRARARAVP